MGAFFYDTYALVALSSGETAYLPYAEGDIVTTRMNLMELYYILYSRIGIEVAEVWYGRFLPFVIDVEDDKIKEAMRFRAAWKKKDISYVDALGYVMAFMLKIPFLTGDKAFEGFQNVEYVK